MIATNFEEFIAVIGDEAPQALVLDWYQRLERSERAYLAAQGIAFNNGPQAERIIAQDQNAGTQLAESVAKLRHTRNEVAHGSITLSADEAKAFAREAFAAIGVLGKAEDAHAT